MKSFRTHILVVMFLAPLLALDISASARGDKDQDHLRQAAAEGQVIPLKRLIDNVRSRAPYNEMTYLGGPQYDASTMRYGLKFLDGNQVVIVYVDARTGRILGRNP